MIQNLIFGILFWKYYFGHTTFLYMFRHHKSFFELPISQQKASKLIKTHFTNFNSLDIENNMLPQHSQKPFWPYKFSSKHVHVYGVRKNICTAPFLNALVLHSWSTLKANVCIFLYIFLRRFLFQRCSKFLSGGGGMVEAE